MSEKKGSYLSGKVLLAMPAMSDPRFHKAVILMCAHDEHGAMGLMVNTVMGDANFEELLEQLGIESDIKIDPSKAPIPVLNGGPVENSRGFLLHSSEFKENDTITINPEFSVTGTIEALKKIAEGQGPDDMLFILGYAGWEAGQLEREIQENAWLITDPDPDIIFRAALEKKWDMATKKMGIDPTLLSNEAGHA